MRAIELLQKIFDPSRGTCDKRLHRTLLESSQTLITCKHLSIGGLGRRFNRPAKVKNNIKTIDRLFGNTRLSEHRINYFKTCTHWLVRNNKRPIIIIDWSGLTRCGQYHFLRASIPVGGRALPILDMAFHLDDYLAKSSHQHFISHLKTILPENCQPIIVTDAGFRCTWFTLVKSVRWDFIGRVRNRTHYKNKEFNCWLPIKSLYCRATTKATYLLSTYLAKSNTEFCHFYILRNKKKNRVKKNVVGKKIQCSTSLKHAKRGREPWLMVTSLSPKMYQANQIMNIYKKRMQIEEGFRDLKNTKNGFSLRHCRSYSVSRLNVALLIAAIAILILWLLGKIAISRGHHLSYQANTVKNRHVLSTITIGWQAVMRNDIDDFTLHEVNNALQQLSSLETNLCF